MSYNIDHVEYVKEPGSEKLRITAGTVKELLDKYEDRLAEDNFLVDLPVKRTTPDDEVFVIERPAWRGEYSGNSYETFLECLKKTTGKAKLLLIWEGGDSQEGLKIVDGVVSKAKIKVSIDD